MADFMTRSKQSVRHEWFLETPTNLVEFQKAMNSAQRYLETQGIVIYDDTLKVESNDEEVIIYWDEVIS